MGRKGKEGLYFISIWVFGFSGLKKEGMWIGLKEME